jgi:LPXTG-motif cell wall-anchored protein
MSARSCIRLSVLFFSCALSAFAADTISGKVHNQTTDKPAAGDDVILLRLEKGMDEEARTKTDSQGVFSLQVSGGGARYIVRVLHKGINYDASVDHSGPLNIPVFDSVARIQDLQAKLGMAQVESDGLVLKITEMYDISNESVPPVTQSRPDNFEISISPTATLDSLVVKKGTGGLWVNVTPVPVKGQQGHYAVDFPLRPGETLFKFVYHLAYSGSANLNVKPAYPVRSFAVLHPASLSFKSSRPAAFTSPGVTHGLQVEQAVSKPIVRVVPAFEITGTGLAEPAQQTAKTSPLPASSSQGAAMAKPVAPVASSATVETDQTASEKWALLAGGAVLLAAIFYMVWKRRRNIVLARK